MQDHAVIGLGESEHGGKRALHQIADRLDESSVGLDAEPPAQIAHVGRTDGAVALAVRIAEILLGDDACERRLDRLCDRKIHVGDEGRDHICRVKVPLVAATAAQGGFAEFERDRHVRPVCKEALGCRLAEFSTRARRSSISFHVVPRTAAGDAGPGSGAGHR